MAVNYTVQADVVDICVDSPKSTDVFLVDTNVWFWMSYAKSSSTHRQAQHYPPFVKQARSNKATLYRCGLSLAELAHLIEKTERSIYKTASGPIRPKEFRHNLSTERSSVVAEVEAAWGLVKTMAEPLDVAVDDPMTDAALTRYKSQPLDGYDLFILEAIQKAGIIQVLTDDGDFCTVPDIQVFTANRNVIAAARAQGKLLSR